MASQSLYMKGINSMAMSHTNEATWMTGDLRALFPSTESAPTDAGYTIV